MGIILSCKEGGELSLVEVTEALHAELKEQGISVEPKEAEETPKNMWALVGEMTYDGRRYDIWCDVHRYTRDDRPQYDPFDALSIDRMDAAVKFSATGHFRVGYGMPNYDFSFKPDQDKVNFLKGLAAKLKERLVQVETVGVVRMTNDKPTNRYEQV